MLRFVRLSDRAFARTVGPRGLTLLVVALAAGGCSAGIDRLGPLNYNGGPTGSAPIPSASMRAGRPTPPPVSDYRQDYRPDSRSDEQPSYQPDYRADDPPAYQPPYGSNRRSDASRAPSRMSDSGARPMQSGDNAVRVAGLPEPYDRTPAPPPAARPAPKVAPFEASRTPPPPPRSALETLDEGPAPAATAAAGHTIEVRAGDTLYALSKAHGVSVAELMRVNGLTGPHLRIGQQLTLPSDGRRTRRVASLPTSEPAPYVPPTPAPYRAPQPQAYVPPPSADDGPIVPPLVETPPAPEPAAAPASPPPAVAASRDDSGWTGTHTVQRGDSLYAIARQHGINLNQLQRANNITNPRRVMPGTVLKVPKAGEEQRVARVTPAPSAPTPTPTVPRTAEPPVASPSPSGPPSVRPTILNPSAEAPATEERTRVAALERNPRIGEQTPSHGPSGAPPATATDAPQRDAALSAPISQPKPVASIGKLRWPARGKTIAGFSAKNEGINISLPRGTPIHAAEAGTVYYAGDGVQGYGNIILIRHADGWITAYAHNDSNLVTAGESVRRGQIIAKAGNTGSVTQPQLHFQIRQGTKPVDPIEHLER